MNQKLASRLVEITVRIIDLSTPQELALLVIWIENLSALLSASARPVLYDGAILLATDVNALLVNVRF